MSNQKIGNPLTTKEIKETSPSIEANESGVTVRRHYNIAKSQIAAEVAGLSWGDADADFSDSLLSGASANVVSPGTMELVLDFTPAGLNDAEVLPPVGTVTKEADSNMIPIPIEQNPNWVSTLQQERKRGGSLEGVDDYLSPQPVYRRSEVLSSFTFSQANVIQNVGKLHSAGLMDTAGLSGATDYYWLKMALRVRQVGDKYEKVEEWQYAENGWETIIYDSVS